MVAVTKIRNKIINFIKITQVFFHHTTCESTMIPCPHQPPTRVDNSFGRWCYYAFTVTVSYVITREWWSRVHFIHAENFSLSTKSNLMHIAPSSEDDLRQLLNCGQWFLFLKETKWLRVLENHDNQSQQESHGISNPFPRSRHAASRIGFSSASVLPLGFLPRVQSVLWGGHSSLNWTML